MAAEISLRDIVEIFDLLAPLEALGKRFALQRMSDETLQDVSDLHDAMIACYRANDREGCFLHDYQFHNAMTQNAQHEVLRATHTSLTNRSQRGRYLAPRFPQEKLDEAMAAHEKLIVAIRDRQIDRASDNMFNHVKRAGEFVVPTLKLSDLVSS